VRDYDLLNAFEAWQVEHGVKEYSLHDGAQPARPSFAVDGFAGDGAECFLRHGQINPVASENPVQIDSRSAAESEHHRRMIALGLLFLRLLCDRFRFAPDSGHRPVLFDHSILPEGRYFA